MRRKKLRRLLLILLIFLGPGTVIWWMASTVENYFKELPVVGHTIHFDSIGKKVDSAAYVIPNFELKLWNGGVINRDSIRGKHIVLSTLQEGCPDLENCGVGVYTFNEVFFHKLADNQDNYGDVKVLSILTTPDGEAIQSGPSELLKEKMQEYDPDIWWKTYGDPEPFYNFHYKGKLFTEYLSENHRGDIGKYFFVNSLILIDKEGRIRSVQNAKRDSDIRTFFDHLKLLKKEEFNEERGQRERPVETY